MLRDPGPTLRAELAAIPTQTQSRPCLTCTLPEDLRKLLEDDRASVAAHSFEQLSRFLQTRGVMITAGAIAGHFRKGYHTK